jgi:hypothetical protein
MTVLPPLASASPATLPILDAPAELTALPVGMRITAAVVAVVNGSIALKTEFGTIMARNGGVSTVPLQKGALVSLLVQTGTPAMALRIVEVISPQGEQVPCATMQGQPAAGGRELAGGQAAATPAVALATPADAAGARIEAIVLRPLAGTAFTPAGGSAEAADAGLEPAVPPLFPANTRLALRMLGSGPAHHPAGARSDGTSSQASRFGGRQTIMASVVRTDAAGRPLLTSSAGLLVLATAMQLPQEWSGEFEILGVRPPPADGLAAEDASRGSRIGGWQTLEHILGSLSQSDPEAARHMSQAVLPRPTSSLAADILKVLGLLRGGDVREWIGNEAYLGLARTRPDLLERLAADIQKLAPGADGNAGGDWRTLTIPVIADGALVAIRMRIRSSARQNEEGAASDSDSTRFVLDLALSRLGRMQIDGLVQAQGRQLDLIVRTERPLAADVQGGIRHILMEAGAVTGLRGAVGFRMASAQVLDADRLPPANRRLRGSLVI